MTLVLPRRIALYSGIDADETVWNGEVIHVACAADENMLIPALALCHSVERHVSGPVHFHLIHSDLSAQTEGRLAQAIAASPHPFTLYRSERDFTPFLRGAAYPPATFFRLEGTLVGGWLKDRFAQAIEATRHDARARRGIFESTRRKRARARLLDGMLYDPWIALKPAGELLCTLARAAGAGSPASRFYAVHQYGAAIIRKAEDRELRARGPQN